ncbi:uncharacterized protein STEHIDRAFT_156702 [Stereum hirsutum FP-91666 SS1]|uniref:uncharacterized protein n=1 Tax=Stereum hirsutum (strain FP-91666) TaxID=721885 RepID=UPI000440DCD6|nr:uncharacterized protein STEHIDRAFT_156702 [Stereum hirsutum FP-91666 SS1]EIM86378.1 hypothetical protein STEHIDRAFT_156702 [Stereum hirsutum FP-91666 SS1]
MDGAPLQSQLNTNFTLSPIYFTIFFYDYVLTLGSEVRYFWPPRNRLTWPSFLFFLNRYLSLLGNILFAIEDFMNPVNFACMSFSCRKLQKANQPYVSVTQIVVCVLCIFRVSAMYNHHRAVLSTLISYGCLMLAIAMWIVISGSEGLPPMLMDPGVPGCNTMVTEAQAKQYLVPWALVLGFDALVFGLTLVKASKIGWESPTHLANVLARDGTMWACSILAGQSSDQFSWSTRR